MQAEGSIKDARGSVAQAESESAQMSPESHAKGMTPLFHFGHNSKHAR